MKKLFILLFTLLSVASFAQVPALNEIVKTNTLSPSRVGAALEVAEPYTASGTDTYTVSISVTGLYSGSATYASGDQFTIIFTNANATTTPTLNINSEGAITIVDNKGNAVAAGDVHGALKLMYDGTNLRIIGAASGGGGGGSLSSVGLTLGTSGTDAGVTGSPLTSDGSITLNIPSSSGSNRGLLTAADWTTFNGKAPLASPTFTGTPAAPTAAGSTNTTQLATTAFVKASSPKIYQFAASDELTALATGTNKITLRIPFAMTVTEVRASLVTAQASGSIFTVDINEGGTSILSTKLTIDNTETTSTTAATPPVISDTSIADAAVITVDIDQIGNGSATGLKVTIIGY